MKLGILVLVWVIALAGAFSLDRQVAQWVHDARPVDKHAPLTYRVLEILKLPGYFPTTLCIAALVALYDRRHALALLGSGIAVGALYSVIKWIAGRHRPVKGIDPFAFHPFPRGLRGLWRPEDALCFPSGHASLAFASATCLAMLLPRWGVLFFAIALVTAAERVLENAHYLSDVVAGAGIGTLTAYFLTRAILSAFPNHAAPAKLKP